MKQTKSIFFVLSVLFIILNGCISQKKMEYLQDPVETSKTYSIPIVEENRIKPNDELYISVSSFDDPDFGFVGTGSEYQRTGYSNDLSVSLISYTVQTDGTIQFPVLGQIQLSGLTLEEARLMMEKSLKDYLDQPMVKIKFSIKKVTILGEVNMPGNYTYSKDHINILEALGIAGDMTVHGNRREVYLMRTNADKLIKYRVDLTQDELVFEKYFNIEPDDIIYVKPRNSRKWNVISIPISLVLSTITTSLLIINYFQ